MAGDLKTLRAVIFRQGATRSSTHLGTILATAAVSVLGLLTVGKAAVPFTSATITKVENRVSFGQSREGRSTSRLATVNDIVRANNFLLSEADSRAELQYPDGSLVRIGQNTVFSFDADSRTLALEKGSLIFHIPKGTGGGTIKTPSLTAAITGTTGKVTPRLIAIIEGVVTLVPSGRLVHGGEYAVRNKDGSITIDFFDHAHARDGRLVDFNGLMPGFEEYVPQELVQLQMPDLRYLEVLHRTQNLPTTIARFFPEPVIVNRGRVTVPRPTTNNPRGVGNY